MIYKLLQSTNLLSHCSNKWFSVCFDDRKGTTCWFAHNTNHNDFEKTNFRGFLFLSPSIFGSFWYDKFINNQPIVIWCKNELRRKVGMFEKILSRNFKLKYQENRAAAHMHLSVISRCFFCQSWIQIWTLAAHYQLNMQLCSCIVNNSSCVNCNFIIFGTCLDKE